MTDKARARIAAILDELRDIVDEPDDDTPEVGAFGKFWDKDEPEDQSARWGYLTSYYPNAAYPFSTAYWAPHKHFRPCLPKEKI